MPPRRVVALTEFVADPIRLAAYPVRYAGCRFSARIALVHGDHLRLYPKQAARRAWRGILGDQP